MSTSQGRAMVTEGGSPPQKSDRGKIPVPESLVPGILWYQEIFQNPDFPRLQKKFPIGIFGKRAISNKRVKIPIGVVTNLREKNGF